MPFEILVVEDEASAREYLCTLIHQFGPPFEVIAQAKNGKEALDLMADCQPDLVLTDVRMPLVDGIRLLETLKASYPTLSTIIVSGYQEFEYARQALSLGVNDYLLKPVNPTLLRGLLEKLAADKDQKKSEAVSVSLRLAVGGMTPAGPLPPLFRIALVRSGGLPTTRAVPATLNVEEKSAPPGIWIYAGRDKKETIHLADAERIPQEVFETAVRSHTEEAKTRAVVFENGTVPPAGIAETVHRLGLTADRILVFGRTRTQWGSVDETPFETLDSAWAQNIRWLLQESAHHKLQDLLRSLVKEWDQKGLTARQAVFLLRQVLLLAQQTSPDASLASRDWDFVVEESQQRVDSMEELAELAWELFCAAAGFDAVNEGQEDAPVVFQQIRRHVQKFFAEPLSLVSVCDRFLISQTYLSRLFRRYEGCTFHDYLTRQRIDAAERLMLGNPELPLKTVALSVGYSDPYIFSRAFKNLRGTPPGKAKT